MQIKLPKSFPLLFGLAITLSFLSSCQEDELVGEILVYENDFSHASSLTNIENGKVHVFENDTILGNYNNEEISLNIEDMPYHNTVRVVIELLLHDSWDGNVGGVGGPDYWYMNVDQQQILYTTFSNSPCVSTYCLYQSYPDNYGRNYDPKTSAVETNLPGLCQYRNTPGWTSKYRISKLIDHSNPNINITCGDILNQSNAPSAICDESWSISKIEVSALYVK
ncbi:hypothetical protein [Echinicola sp. 20G]|uniref:hypothetical protein n=1 Tax=Echinicola sp. 20G TaxID=2781961 RepID=UPI00190FF0ED|nr:hypothetical protein [Echinicola sp. 20G]